MAKFTVVANVFDRDGNETKDKIVPIDAADTGAAHALAAELLGAKYEQFYIKEVRSPEHNPVKTCQAAIRADPDWSRPETMAALAKYFRATGQAWLCTPTELK